MHTHTHRMMLKLAHLTRRMKRDAPVCRPTSPHLPLAWIDRQNSNLWASQFTREEKKKRKRRKKKTEEEEEKEEEEEEEEEEDDDLTDAGWTSASKDDRTTCHTAQSANPLLTIYPFSAAFEITLQQQ